MSAPNDRDVLAGLLELTTLSENQREAFEGMIEWLDGGPKRRLTVKQHTWVQSAAVAANIVVDEAQNLHSAGLVPLGIATPKTPGEKFAASVLARQSCGTCKGKGGDCKACFGSGLQPPAPPHRQTRSA